ncbi:tol-pal system YbgF family protein [Anaeromyxobacter oryzisoli]|uniref:hypothetical protein n=1 Tax=Anaeromyxobacter oryzisoli TaxID=2925408 RepID=UPI001F57A632|nr:hypothetical protein [Anaeromyxobacter sp. SG63]
MSVRGACAAAVALAAAALLPGSARADALADVERQATEIEQRLAQLEAQAWDEDEPAPARAARQFAEGETQYLLGDWQHAAILLSEVVDEPALRATRDYPTAVFYLAEALRRQGACGAALPRYDAYLSLPEGERRGDALVGAIECGVKARRTDAVEKHVAEADRVFAGNPPPELRYLAAKALYQRSDLAPAVRFERAMAAFEAVPAPYRHQAAYFQGVLQIERGDLAAAIQRFELCAGEKAADDRQREVVELCDLALGRIHGDQGRPVEALDWYARVPWTSRHFTEAAYESAWAFVRAGQLEAALRTASLIADVAPESPLAPEATVLQGHLLLRLGQYAEATEAYSRVINDYAPVRDELDAILAMREDPVRYFNELIGREGEAFDVAAVLPAVAVRWASAQAEVAEALELTGELDASHRDVDDGNAIAGRVEALLARGNGLDAFPRLREAYATAHAMAQAATALDDRAADAAFATTAAAVTEGERAKLEAAHAERAALGRRLASVPRTADEARARAARMRGRVAELERRAYRLGYELEAAKAAIAGAERWLEDHRADITANTEARTDFSDELRKHRETVAGYEVTLRALRQDVALALDGATASEALAGEVKLRERHASLVARERTLLEAHRAAPGVGAALDRSAALRGRSAAVQRRAEALSARLAAVAARRAGEVQARVAAERTALAEEARTLAGIQGDAKDLVGKIAYQSFTRVREQFYRLVLKADVGLVDVAWARKRVRLEKIQQLSQQKGEELKQLEDAYGSLLREVD